MRNKPINPESRVRLQNALWGLFIGDALAMPAHWYYQVDTIKKVFDDGICDYQEPPHPHLESFMVGMAYYPDIETARRQGRPFDILHEHARFYHTSYSSLEIKSTEREKAHGNQLFEAYQDHAGPGNIDKRKMWDFHTHLANAPYEIDQLVRDSADSEVINHLFATACYPEHGLPLLLYFAKAYNVDVESALLANANAGGDNVHRGMVLGLLLGAANKELPEHLKKRLIAFNDLQTEIEAFSDIALGGNAI